ncbi:MAG: iron complex transport system permease protein [Parasphingorhabdus sp.]
MPTVRSSVTVRAAQILLVFSMTYRILIPILLALALLVLIAALMTGTIPVQLADISGIWNSPETREALVIRELRFPRAANGFLAGAMLALAGTLLQVLLRNPLADPYVLGISGGASVVALVLILLGMQSGWIMAGAFGGASLATLLVFVLAYGNGIWSATRLLLTGVVLASGWGAIISFLLAISGDQRVFSMLFWLMGDLRHADAAWWPTLILGPVFAVMFWKARDLNLLSVGDLKAQSLGVEVQQVRWLLFLSAALLTATAVTLAGSIGFVGLVVPHMVRLIAGGNHRGLLPACLLLGGILVVGADTLARTMLAPRELPVGIITAFIGVPMFLILLKKTMRTG